MNTPLRRVSLAVMVLILLLLGQATWIQVVKADEYRADPRNARVLLDEYARQRGQISAGGEVLAQSVQSPDPGDRLRYLRQYTDGPLYAPVTGYYSQIYGAGGMERAMDPVLNGTDDRLFVRRISDAVTGRDPAGGNVVLSIDPRVQRAAYEAMTSRGYQGSVVAIRPQTGEIVAMVSTPSYDPNPLASHSGTTQQNAWNELTEDDPPTLTNRAISETYPPGSTFKIVNTAAALEAGLITPDAPVTAAPRITLPDSTTTLENYDGKPCGPGATVPFATAFAKSCNGPFANLAVQVGADRLRQMATSLGFGNPGLTVPMPVQASEVGDLDDGASLAQSGIGQRDVRLTPLQNAMITATVANGGVTTAPHTVAQIQGQDLSTVEQTEPDSTGRAFSRATADTLTQLMIGSENNGSGQGRIPGVQIASKTGTAEWGANPKTNPPHTWYDAFGPVPNPQIAVSVIVERGGNRGEEATGGSVASPIGRAVIAAALRGDG
ncbi:peptidoglycan D,D-transpeptidase FtsI family protein [Actinomycetospora lemnae]|uniref:Penicillin-binding protein 2 n=1 Tax=Actinomycetospora lemnae TaxID=3019891 RepID=A0ABT5STQ9_9PSEU|nr:penicillin-binding protein 2 [Actinomycetospora sp. DW7H6]MDD7966236.1 penicillin-binding protein 2 [Actinomycetospora sp. DW7H6]